MCGNFSSLFVLFFGFFFFTDTCTATFKGVILVDLFPHGLSNRMPLLAGISGLVLIELGSDCTVLEFDTSERVALCGHQVGMVGEFKQKGEPSSKLFIQHCIS